MNTTLKLHGLVAATHTPMNADGTCNPNAVDAQAAFLASQGIKLAFITGSTGESAHMQLTERKENMAAWAKPAPSTASASSCTPAATACETAASWPNTP